MFGDDVPRLVLVLPFDHQLRNGVLGSIQVVSGVDFTGFLVLSTDQSVLQSGGFRRNINFNFWMWLWGQVRVEFSTTWNETFTWQFGTLWRLELEVFTIWKLDGVLHWVEVHVTRVDHSSDNIWRNVDTVPLTDTWTTGVGQDNSTVVLESVNQPVSFNGGSDLLGTWSDEEWDLWLQPSSFSLLDQRDGTRHVLVGRVVDFNDLIVRGVGVSLQETELGVNFVGSLGNGASVSGDQVSLVGLLVWESGSGGTNFSTHVTDSSHTGTRQGLDTFTKVLDNVTGTTSDGQFTGQVGDDVLWSTPAVQLALQVDTHNLRGLQFPRSTG
ncbi:hypothetical protein WICPIJ_002264 [Wickerhamomyces pijperi]|uniref:Uncharacterized protein n=1 Tax=Wickerhamomyces pijperi TaxID=599730 RepID=A0A9P8QC50_WICPI|nr:hypothetical protein WICPIJ_002264 [Wickerhamomyces pijperi]